jgi:hypothetical protein
MGKVPVWDEMPDRDPLERDALEVPDELGPEENALHVMGEPSYDDREQDDIIERLADDGS